MTKPSYRFIYKPAVAAQRKLISTWLHQDYVNEWIHGKGLQNTLKGLEIFIEAQSDDKSLGRETEITQHWIGYDGEKPFVYLLTSNVLRNSNSEYSKYLETDGYAITLDIFICDPDYLGKGLACCIIEEFISSKFSDISEVFIDPEKNNKRAVHVYQKIGFRIMAEFIASWHPVPHLLMKLNVDQLIRSYHEKSES